MCVAHVVMLRREKVAPVANSIMEEALKVISAYQQARLLGDPMPWRRVEITANPRFEGVPKFCMRRCGVWVVACGSCVMVHMRTCHTRPCSLSWL